MRQQTIEGLYGIKATVIADSIDVHGINRLTTFEVEYWRGVLAELNTHKMISKNSSSSRAMPFAKMQENLIGRPVRFGANQAGMQDKGEDFYGHGLGGFYDGYTAAQWWDLAKLSAIRFAQELSDAGYHKQVFNRLVEPFQMMKTVLTATEWDNFFWLRYHGAADPSLEELARVMRLAKDASVPHILKPGRWHLPYVETQEHGGSGEQLHFLNAPAMWDECLQLEDALKVSAARTAAVSFRNTDYDLDKCREVYTRLVGADRKHASAFEHQGMAMHALTGNGNRNWDNGVSHMDRDGNLWSANFRGFVQMRKLIPGENYTGE